MKLSDLLKKEELRTGEKIVMPSETKSEEAKPVFGKRRPWLDAAEAEKNQIAADSNSDTRKQVETDPVVSSTTIKDKPKPSEEQTKKLVTAAAEPIHETRVNPVQDPYKTRVNSVPETDVNPVQDPYKTRVSEDGSNNETRIPTRVSKNANPYKTRVKPVQKIKSVQTLSGKQKDAFLFLLLDAKENGSSIENGDRITSHICSAVLSEAASTSGYEATRAVTNALKKSGLLERYQTKDGPGGWTIYRISKSTYLEGLNCLSRIKPVEDPYKTRVNPVYQPVYKPVQTVSSSSRDLSLSNSTTTQNSVADDIGTLDLSELREFGITTETFKRAVQLHPTVKTEALHDLAFRLSELFKNPKERAKIQNARGFVIRLVEQLSHGIIPLDHIETAHDRLMREYALLAKQKRIERQDFEEMLLQDAFEKWDKETLEEDKFRQVPLAQNAPPGSPRIAVLREHFREQVWPEKRQELTKGAK